MQVPPHGPPGVPSRGRRRLRPLQEAVPPPGLGPLRPAGSRHDSDQGGGGQVLVSWSSTCYPPVLPTPACRFLLYINSGKHCYRMFFTHGHQDFSRASKSELPLKMALGQG